MSNPWLVQKWFRESIAKAEAARLELEAEAERITHEIARHREYITTISRCLPMLEDEIKEFGTIEGLED